MTGDACKEKHVITNRRGFVPGNRLRLEGCNKHPSKKNEFFQMLRLRQCCQTIVMQSFLTLKAFWWNIQQCLKRRLLKHPELLANSKQHECKTNWPAICHLQSQKMTKHIAMNGCNTLNLQLKLSHTMGQGGQSNPMEKLITQESVMWCIHKLTFLPLLQIGTSLLPQWLSPRLATRGRGE